MVCDEVIIQYADHTRAQIFAFRNEFSLLPNSDPLTEGRSVVTLLVSAKVYKIYSCQERV